MILVAADFFLFAASALVAPWWAVTGLMLAWLVLFVLACSWWTPHPRRITVAAVLAAVAWFVVLLLGASQLGWSA